MASTTQGFVPSNTSLAASERNHKVDDCHWRDVAKSSTQRTGKFIVYSQLTYFYYVKQAIQNLFLIFISDWSVIIFQPLTFFSAITLVPIFSFVLLAVEGFLSIGSKLGMGRLIKHASNKWGEGFSMANWCKQLICSYHINVECDIKRHKNIYM